MKGRLWNEQVSQKTSIIEGIAKPNSDEYSLLAARRTAYLACTQLCYSTRCKLSFDKLRFMADSPGHRSSHADGKLAIPASGAS